MKIPSWVKKLWRAFIEIGTAYQILYTIGPSAFFLFLWSLIYSRLTRTLTKPPTQWYIQEWSIVAVVFLTEISCLLLFAYLFGVQKRKSITAPTDKTLSIIHDDHGIWHSNKGPIKAKIIFKTGFWITNIHTGPVNVVKCQMARYNLSGIFRVINKDNPELFGQLFRLPPHELVLISTEFYLNGMRLTKRGEVDTNVTFTDNFGNEHVVQNCRFKYQPPEKKKL